MCLKMGLQNALDMTFKYAFKYTLQYKNELIYLLIKDSEFNSTYIPFKFANCNMPNNKSAKKYYDNSFVFVFGELCLFYALFSLILEINRLK